MTKFIKRNLSPKDVRKIALDAKVARLQSPIPESSSSKNTKRVWRVNSWDLGINWNFYCNF